MTATPALGEGPDNPAVLSVELAALLPTGVAAAHLYQAASEGLLLAAEAPSTNHWSRKRWQDFTAGRVCARAVRTDEALIGHHCTCSGTSRTRPSSIR